MKRSKFTDEQILAIVKEGEAGRKVADLCRTHGITEQTYYRWKAKYGGIYRSITPFLPSVVRNDDRHLGKSEVPGAIARRHPHRIAATVFVLFVP